RVIGGFGLGVNDVQVCIDALRCIDLDVLLLAGRYTLLDQSASAELFPLCQRRGVGIVIGGPFNSGILATGSHPSDGSAAYYDYAPAKPEVMTRVEAIESHCRAFGVPLAAAALQFPPAHPAVLVQAAPTIAETRFLLDVARNSGGLVRGVVGWADLAAPDAVPTIEKLAANRLLKSMRPMLQDLEDPCWITQPQVAIALRALAGLGLRFDALVTPRELPWLLETLPRHPKLAVVVDHCAKPDIAHAVWQPWAADIAALAADTSAYCKLSGLVTEAGAAWTI